MIFAWFSVSKTDYIIAVQSDYILFSNLIIIAIISQKVTCVINP